MKNFWFFLAITCIFSLLVFGCNKAETEDYIAAIVKKNSKMTSGNYEGYGTIIPCTGNCTGTGTGSGTGTGTGTGTEDSIRLVFAGDVKLAGNVKSIVVSNGGGSYQFPFQYVAEYLRNADLAFVNLESVITSAGTTSNSNAFRADPAAVNGLTYAGVDVVSVANDHAFDYGRTGFNDSLQNLENAGIAYIGGGSFNDCYTAKTFTVKGTTIAFLAFTNLTNVGDEYTVRVQRDDSSQDLAAQTGVAWFYTKYVGPAIIAAKKTADVVIVSLHAGTEGQTLPNLSQDRRAHYCVDQGANLVIGHHPQAIQPVMVYIKGHIAYSLGNFITDASTASARKGMLLEVVITDNQITAINRKYVQINSYYQPVVTE